MAMKITKTIYFHRGDVVESEGTLYIYLGKNVWMSKDTHTIYHGRNTVAVSDNRDINLGLTYITDGSVIDTILEGIPKVNGVLLKDICSIK